MIKFYKVVFRYGVGRLYAWAEDVPGSRVDGTPCTWSGWINVGRVDTATEDDHE